MAKKQVKKNPTVETPDIVMGEPKVLLKGTVTDCFRLNIRNKPSLKAEVVAIVSVNAVLRIDESQSEKDWYFVTDSDGHSGYCMKQYVSMKR